MSDDDANVPAEPDANGETPRPEDEAGRTDDGIPASDVPAVPDAEFAPATSDLPEGGAEEEAPPDDEGEPVTHPLTPGENAQPEPLEASPEPPAQGPRVAQADDTSDAASIPDEPEEGAGGHETAGVTGDWQTEMSAQRLAIELKRIETRVRELLSDRDSRRKRKLAGTFRWHELEQDIIVWRADGRMAPETLEELHRLVIRRHFVFNQLRFAAATRPTWNS